MTGRSIDNDLRRRSKLKRPRIRTLARTNVELIAMPGAGNDAVHHLAFIEGAEEMWALR
jgi:hypothetical protein